MLRRRHQRLPLCLAHAHFRVLSAQGMAAAAGALHAQCLHGNVELAVVIVQKLMALDPSNHDAGKYVTIRKFYLEDGNWQADVTMDRCEVMLEAGIKKTAARCAVRKAVLCSTLLPSLHICSQVLLKKKKRITLLH